ncbi:MAG: hypothetical protein AB1649_16640 [Chloroflexota bacterium]
MRVKEQPVLLLMGGSIFTNPGTGLLGTLQTELETVDEKIRFASATDCLQTLHRWQGWQDMTDKQSFKLYGKRWKAAN